MLPASILHRKIGYFMFALIGFVNISLITQSTLQKMVYFSIVIAYLITTKYIFLHLFVIFFFHSNFIISVNIIVVLQVWLLLLLRSLSSLVCFIIFFFLQSQPHHKTNLHSMMLYVRLIFFFSSVNIITCVQETVMFNLLK